MLSYSYILLGQNFVYIIQELGLEGEDISVGEGAEKSKHLCIVYGVLMFWGNLIQIL